MSDLKDEKLPSDPNKGQQNSNDDGKNQEKNSIADYFKLGEVATYFFRKKDPKRPTNFNIRAMHTINKISIIVFLLAIMFFLIRKFL